MGPPKMTKKLNVFINSQRIILVHPKSMSAGMKMGGRYNKLFVKGRKQQNRIIFVRILNSLLFAFILSIVKCVWNTTDNAFPASINTSMGVLRLFFKGRQNFPGGQKHTTCLKNAPKNTIFFQKSGKTYYFG